MRRRLLADPDAHADYEILEMLLFLGISRRNTKPFAKGLIIQFGSLTAVVMASPEELESAGLNAETVTALNLVVEAAGRGRRVARGRVHAMRDKGSSRSMAWAKHSEPPSADRRAAEVPGGWRDLHDRSARSGKLGASGRPDPGRRHRHAIRCDAAGLGHESPDRRDLPRSRFGDNGIVSDWDLSHKRASSHA
jgi:hypothetical protein